MTRPISLRTPSTEHRGSGSVELHPLARLPEDWQSVVDALGEPSYRASQIFAWIMGRGVMAPEKMSNLPQALRRRLAELGLAEPATVELLSRSADHTRKLLIGLHDGARVECVLIPMSKVETDADAAAIDEADDESELEDRSPKLEPKKQRVTLCISTQVGCAMGCVFCASGQAGLVRGLGAAEIVSQVLIAKRYLEPDETLRNLVFMGMGEPLHHYDETARALRLLMHPDGLGFSPRRITVSTVGLVPGIRRLGQDFGGKLGLAISLHASDDETRSRIVPINRRYPLAELMQAVKDYPLPRRRRITIEYTLIAGVNDSLAQARALVRLLAGLRVKLNLIPMNPIAASPLGSSSAERVAAFREHVARAGVSCFVRTRRGDDVSAACGQLALGSEATGH
jgi:23S rRNA (adenine2503-C2)-methyltransferase